MANIMDGSAYLNQVKDLILEYTETLGRDLSFQHLSEELEHLDTKYTPPNGQILVALSDTGDVIGCVAYHRHSETRCEMKRLYVRPDYRGHRIGEALVSQILALAQTDGYREMVLDTLQFMKSAISLYTRFGFQQTAAYYENPMEDVIYLKLEFPRR